MADVVREARAQIVAEAARKADGTVRTADEIATLRRFHGWAPDILARAIADAAVLDASEGGGAA